MTQTATTTRYYDGSTPDRTLVMCPDCGGDAVLAVGGHHSGTCKRRLIGGRIRTDMDDGLARLAEKIIRDTAATREVFSSNDTRQEMDAKSIPVSLRIAAFRHLTGEVMTPVGYEPSKEHKPRRGRPPRDVRTYRSLIFAAAAAGAER